MDRTGQRATALVTLAGSNIEPTWTADGRHLLFLGIRSGSAGLWTMPVRGGAPAGEPVRLRQGFTRGLKVVSTKGSLYYRRQAGNDFETVVVERTPHGVTVLQSFSGSRPALSIRS
jgi:hypothetical protein